MARCIGARSGLRIWSNKNHVSIQNYISYAKYASVYHWMVDVKLHISLIFPWGCDELTHLPWTKWPTSWQTTISDAFSWMTMIEFWFEFHWSLFPGAQLTINQHLFRKWLVAEQATSHYLKQCWPSSLTHICGTSGRWVNYLFPS